MPFQQQMEKVMNIVSKTLNLNGDEHFTNESMKNDIIFIISAILTQLLLLMLGKFLWNTYLTKVVTVITPVKSIWQILGVSLLLKLMC